MITKDATLRQLYTILSQSVTLTPSFVGCNKRWMKTKDCKGCLLCENRLPWLLDLTWLSFTHMCVSLNETLMQWRNKQTDCWSNTKILSLPLSVKEIEDWGLSHNRRRHDFVQLLSFCRHSQSVTHSVNNVNGSCSRDVTDANIHDILKDCCCKRMQWLNYSSDVKSNTLKTPSRNIGLLEEPWKIPSIS
jgi:hypothetical protein